MLSISSYWPLWLAVMLSMAAGAYQLITEFQRLANLLGPIGRNIYRKSRERFKMDTADFNEAVRNAVAQERQRWEEDEARALTVVEKRMEYFIALTKQQQVELSEYGWQQRCHTAYAEYESQWHHQLRMAIMKAHRNGGAIPVEELPESMHYNEFETLCKERNSFNWRTWDLI